MAALRFIGALLALAAVVALVSDLTPRARPNPQRPTFATLASTWAEIAPQSLAASRKTVQTRVSSALWDVIAVVIGLPVWLSLGGLAALVLYVGRRRHRVEIFAN
jgi:L-alanine-DL-glutamate epimerase-like enolase superfamily enzyme